MPLFSPATANVEELCFQLLLRQWRFGANCGQTHHPDRP
jgi:hypothetical protein